MSQASPSPSNGDTTQERTDCERITDVRDLDVSDRILVGGRVKPIIVDDTGSRTIDTLRGEREQHAAEASGTWQNSKSVLFVNRIHKLRGHRTGEISVDLGAPEPVWRVRE